ncbi:Pentatricopeptide repeat-containing protein, mitochondrial [Neolecta irregularis DAH-3]|uniref:Pentatricopeptide repeat-containing protein, mitochondrial n=1 Tax=Neolecta irregularis (strain DAH-3) TaxID=1198029 RepID=A0A1U7LW50_NEOID|nr:Pentatricopeptide repeat-containing protein, mitochondrial [Neolecta irregularis DAH-3]|eukprot:OLL26848.1 Pentatricopeptide repeat-containing protein, mitochondrial [Neolecta irregularis DAH-3]
MVLHQPRAALLVLPFLAPSLDPVFITTRTLHFATVLAAARPVQLPLRAPQVPPGALWLRFEQKLNLPYRLWKHETWNLYNRLRAIPNGLCRLTAKHCHKLWGYIFHLPQRSPGQIFELANAQIKFRIPFSLQQQTAYIEALYCLGKKNHAYQIFANGPPPGTLPDTRWFNVGIQMHAKDRDLLNAEQVLQRLLSTGAAPTSFSFMPLIMNYCLLKNKDRALLSYSRMKSACPEIDLQSYEAVLFSFFEAGYPSIAARVYDDILAASLTPSTLTTSVMYDHLAKRANNLTELLNLGVRINNINREFAFDPFYYASVMANLCRLNEMDYALVVFKGLRNADEKLDTIHYNIIIGGYLKVNNDMPAAESLAQDMFKSDGTGKVPQPDVSTFGMLVQWYVDNDQPTKVFSLIQTMKSLGIKPNTYIANMLLHLWNIRRNRIKFWETFDEMKLQEIQQDAHTFGMAWLSLYLTAYAKRDVMQHVRHPRGLFRQMLETPNLDPHVRMFDIVIKAFLGYKDPAGCLIAYEAMIRHYKLQCDWITAEKIVRGIAGMTDEGAWYHSGLLKLKSILGDLNEIKLARGAFHQKSPETSPQTDIDPDDLRKLLFKFVRNTKLASTARKDLVEAREAMGANYIPIDALKNTAAS